VDLRAGLDALRVWGIELRFLGVAYRSLSSLSTVLSQLLVTCALNFMIIIILS
jgi:hypothetical protein